MGRIVGGGRDYDDRARRPVDEVSGGLVAKGVTDYAVRALADHDDVGLLGPGGVEDRCRLRPEADLRPAAHAALLEGGLEPPLHPSRRLSGSATATNGERLSIAPLKLSTPRTATTSSTDVRCSMHHRLAARPSAPPSALTTTLMGGSS